MKTLPQTLLVLHCLVGSIGILLFLGEGMYMMQAHNALQDMPDGPRMLFRSAHIYTLLLASFHLAFASITAVWKPIFPLIIIASGLSFLSFIFISYGFFNESFAADLNRPISKLGLFSMFAVALILSLNAIFVRLGFGQALDQ